MFQYTCGCLIGWFMGSPPSKCPVHWIQEQIREGDHQLENRLYAAKPLIHRADLVNKDR